MLPSGFIFGVVAPLNLDKLHHATLHSSFIMINNGNWVLFVGKARLKFKRLEVDGVGWNTKTLLQLRNMKNIVHCREWLRKFQLISYCANFLGNPKGSHIAWR